ncbi:hypothetical protein SPRG_11311 [Saprolegnia parasitica CBS 223.65]|uniref:Uncharacterized protein n=1 Tax=Saprolegnia parasitica (strain CBS 223.65) TaxID=695850 RepID=A0A067BV08_SAPPC|nr:hypothetical protein SPRG_11311 [Saprolegnia parasitica CBS 223.65]KDO22359.1 hypothetical protein SPRG_11311 [Saprolegnia parasitica CBS 223.65]|eukprot:XP_012206883.1 hypothetical protein SPRG_11311 [Saprolegnia parasitica CBS 223.65]
MSSPAKAANATTSSTPAPAAVRQEQAIPTSILCTCCRRKRYVSRGWRPY